MDNPQCHLSEDSPLGGDNQSSLGSTIRSGQTQCVGRHSVSSEPDSGVRMDSEVGGVPPFEQEVAGDDRSFCHLVESPLFTLFFALPRSLSDRYGCASSELGRVLGSDVNVFFPVEKKLFFRKKTTKIKKTGFFLVSRIKFVNNGKTSCLCVK